MMQGATIAHALARAFAFAFVLALALAALASDLRTSGVQAWHCRVNSSEPDWPDFCDGTSTANPHCKRYEPLWHKGSPDDWRLARALLRQSIFGGEPPRRSKPDEGPTPYTKPVVFANCMCLQRGECLAEECARPINATYFTWVTTVPVNSTYNVTLKSHVFHSLNSSGIAASNTEDFGEWGVPEARWPEVPIAPKKMSDTLVIFHDGHTVTNGCHYDVENTIDWLNQLGYDVFHIQMPFHGCNAEDPLHPLPHSWFAQFAGLDGANSSKFPFMRFFLDPVWLSVNYAKDLGYKNIVMAGLSGGGWTTTVAAAIDTRIGLSLPVAGSIPCSFAHTSWDFEQYCDQPWAGIANYTSLYVLATLERSRSQIQILHEWDRCCFHTCGRHERIAEYNRFVRASGAGQFVTAATTGNVHEVNPRDRVIIASLIQRWLHRGGALEEEDIRFIPFSITPLPGTPS